MGNEYPYSNGDLPIGVNYTPSSGVKFKKGEIDKTSKTLELDGDRVNNVLGRTNGTDLAWPGYGLYLMQLNGKHTDARNEHAKVLKVAQDVLDSWRTAFVEADRRYTKSDDDSPINNLPNTNFPSTNLPNTSLPNTNFPNTSLPNTNLPNYQLPNTDLPNTDLPNTDLPNSGLPGSGLPNSGLPGSGLTDPSLANPDLANQNLKNPDLANLNPNDPKLTDPNLANPNLPDPTKTGLAGYDPSTMPSIQQPRLPEGATSMDPARFTTGSPGTGTVTGTGSGTGTGVGGLGPGNQVPALAKGAANGLGGPGGMPFMPMAPMGAGQGEREKDGSGSDLLRGDEEDWETDEDVAPAVLKHEDF
ncbi:hypothetical protein [Nonomuraea cavernae]|uniref:hypothetical protein n=1 Tax=Nonomuraea cavernae TaxID=2045107 RepID=UPI0033D732D4